MDELFKEDIGDSGIFTWEGNIYFVNKGKSSFLISGKPNLAAYDPQEKRVILGFNSPRSYSIKIFEGNLLNSVYSYNFDSKGLFTGGPFKLSANQFLLPMINPGTYNGANLDYLLYVDVANEAKEIVTSNNGTSVNKSCDRINTIGGCEFLKEKLDKNKKILVTFDKKMN